MRFVAKERKTIDAIRWTGDNVTEVEDWAQALGLTIDEPEGSALCWQAPADPDPGRGEQLLELWAITLHGEVEIGIGSWAAFGGTDVYPLDDGELRRLYVEAVSPEVEEFLKPFGPAELGRASTRQLLDEIATRMEISQNSTKGRDLGRLAREAIENLAPGILDYRTVDS